MNGPSEAYLPTLCGERVSLRSLEDADLDALLAIFGDTDVVRFMSIGLLRDHWDARGLLEEIRAGASSGTLFQWGIVDDTVGAVVGTCTLAGIDRVHGRAEVGFALAREHWGRGLMAAAMPLMVEHAFLEMGLHRLEADVDPSHHRSLRVLERLGFRREGLLRERHLVEGERRDSVLLGLLTSDWRRAE